MRNHQLHGYFRYVDDILIVYKDSLTNIHEILELFNNISPKLTFTMEEEINNSINFLDITIYKTNQNISFNTYRKPTATDTTIPNESCHPHEHKMAANRYLANRIVSYPMNDTRFDTIIHRNSGRGHPTQQTPCACHWPCSVTSQHASRQDNQQHRRNRQIQWIKIYILLPHTLANDITINLTHTHILQILILNNRTILATKRKLKKLECNLPTTSVIDSRNKCMAEDAN